MKTRFHYALAATAMTALGATAAQPAAAEDLCKPAAGLQKTADEVKTALEAQGYTIRNMDEESGCIEAKGMDSTGKRVEMYIDPVSGAIVKVK